MQRRMNIQASSLIILLSVLTILVQFTAYYFIEANYIIWGAACIITIVCCHILQEETSTYEACFQYSFLTLFISLVILVVTYFGNVQDFLPYSSIMLGIAVINWFLPLLHCFIRYMLEYGTKVDDFNEFYRNTSILFLVIYLSVIFYGAFVKNSFPWAYPLTYDTYNLMPFGILSTQIEDYLYGNIPLSDIITYLLSRTLVFLPYGFYITLLLRRQARLAR
ncbi:MAG TPA: hypothetical protein VN258_07230, partial [Mobilitalea sp.]|nr:hypothetical protein [Mobilitalea sp.]